MQDGGPDLADYRGPCLRAWLATVGGDFKDRLVFAFAGIGRPEKFVISLKQAGAIVTGTQFFADHHAFQPGEIDALKVKAGAAQLITTEKDFVRLSAPERAGVAVLKVTARFEDDVALLLNRLTP